MSRELVVSSNARVVGHLREQNDLWEFEYDPAWTASDTTFALSPALPREPRRHQDGASLRPVQWYFDNLLPEEALRTALAKEADLEAEDAFGLLAYFGAESAGSLILADPAHPQPAEPGLRELTREALSRRIQTLPTASLTKDAPKKMSLAGTQHKMLVVVDQYQLFEPLPGTPSTYILKPNHQSADYPASVMNEYFTMRLAKAVGLKDVPEVRRLYVPEPVYLVKRFDRTRQGGEVHRLHVIDTCQLLNKSRQFKYTSANLESLSLAVKQCRQMALARVELYKWILFNCLVGNSDNHLKNISFLVDTEGIRLAPAYDLLSTAVYETPVFAAERANWPDTELALSLGDVRRFRDVSRDGLIKAGLALGLNADVAGRHLDQLMKRMTAAAEDLVKEIERENAEHLEDSPEREVVGRHIAREMRLLRAITHIVMKDVIERVK